MLKGLAPGEPPSPRVVAVCGAGAMGTGIAEVAAGAGHAVLVFDPDAGARARGARAIGERVAARRDRGRLSAADASDLLSRIQWAEDLSALAGAALVVEAIVEDFEAKAALFRRLEEIVAPEALLATNTSSLSVTALAARLARPQRFLGLHFFNPAPAMKLVEVVPGPSTEAAAIDAAMALMTAWGKAPARVRDVPGFIVNRVARPFYAEAWRALEEGAADAASIDALFRELAGFRMGPLELGDLIGHDVNFGVARGVHEAYFGRTRFQPSLAQGALVAAGRLGRKTGAGVYDYSADAARPAAKIVATPPEKIEIRTHPSGPMAALLTEMGAPFFADRDAPRRAAEVGPALVAFCDGRPARRLAKRRERPVATLDWIGRPETKLVAFAASCADARRCALGFIGALGRSAVEIADRPGLIVLRTMLQLANAAGDALRDRVAEEAAIDAAMRDGANYPIGPFAFLDAFGPSRAARTLSRIAKETGDPIYLPGEAVLARGLG